MELTLYHNGPDMQYHAHINSYFKNILLIKTNKFHYCVMNILDGPAL